MIQFLAHDAAKARVDVYLKRLSAYASFDIIFVRKILHAIIDRIGPGQFL